MKLRAALLLVASVGYVLLVYVAANYIWHSGDPLLMSSGQEPPEGWNYWRWYFIKDHAGDILWVLLGVVALGAAILYEWVRFFRAKNHRR